MSEQPHSNGSNSLRKRIAAAPPLLLVGGLIGAVAVVAVGATSIGGGNGGSADYRPPTSAEAASGSRSDGVGGVDVNRIRVVRAGVPIAVLDIAAWLDSRTDKDCSDTQPFPVTCSRLGVQDGRLRQGVLLIDVLAQAGVDSWSSVLLRGGLGGEEATISRADVDQQPAQYLLYWSGDDRPSPTVTLESPVAGSVVDVYEIVVDP